MIINTLLELFVQNIFAIAVCLFFLILIIGFTKGQKLKSSVKCSKCKTRFKVNPAQIHESVGQPSGIGDDGFSYWIHCPHCHEPNSPY